MNQQELDKLLKLHDLWLKSYHKEGKRLDLSYKNCKGLNIKRANLEGANLKETILDGIIL